MTAIRFILSEVSGGVIVMFYLKFLGMPKFLETFIYNYISNFSSIVKDIVSIILNMGRGANQNDFKIVDAPRSIIVAILELFSKKGYFKLDKYTNGSFRIYMLNGNGKRNLRRILDG